MIAATPTKYALGATHGAPPKIAPANRAMIGSLAPHGIKVVVMMVIRRSRSFSMVLEAITPGTPHPVPISIGMKDLPDRPNLRKIRSMMNATRAMYPQSSRIARKKNSVNICGTNPRTAPTPAMIPSRIRLCSHPAQPMLVRNPSTAGGTISPNSTSFTQSVIPVPTVEIDT